MRAPKQPNTVYSVPDAVSEAFGTFAELAEELRNWYDSMPEGLQGGDKASQLEESADALENLQEPSEVPGYLSTFEIKPLPRRRQSRADRNGYAVGLLEDAKALAEAWLDDTANAEHEDRDDMESFRDELDTAIDEAQGVEFPGMYG